MSDPPRPTLTSIPPRPDASTEVGKRVGRYELRRKLPNGGIGTLWVASAAGKEAVLERVKRRLLSDPAVAERVFHAARAAARIEHPNVVATLDVMVSDGELCIVTELVKGERLEAIVRGATAQGQPLPPAVVVRLLLDLLAGLDAGHALADGSGVHGGLAPDNVLVTKEGRGVLLGFGLAKAFVGTPGSAAKSRERVGYQAPEQLGSAPTSDARSDLFALGVLAWELFAGVRLFDSKYEAAAAQKILTTTPPRLDELGKGSPALAEVVARALQRDPSARFATAREMASALTGAAEGVASAEEVAAEVRRAVEPHAHRRRKSLEPAEWPTDEGPTIPRAPKVPTFSAEEAPTVPRGTSRPPAPAPKVEEAPSEQAGTWSDVEPETAQRAAISAEPVVSTDVVAAPGRARRGRWVAVAVAALVVVAALVATFSAKRAPSDGSAAEAPKPPRDAVTIPAVAPAPSAEPAPDSPPPAPAADTALPQVAEPPAVPPTAAQSAEPAPLPADPTPRPAKRPTKRFDPSSI